MSLEARSGEYSSLFARFNNSKRPFVSLESLEDMSFEELAVLKYVLIETGNPLHLAYYLKHVQSVIDRKWNGFGPYL